MLERILKGLFGGTIETILNAAAAKQPEPEPLPTQGIRMLMLTRAREVNPDEWEIDTGAAKIVFQRSSWESARAARVTFKGMLAKVEDKTFEVLYWLATRPEVQQIDVSSLWRPYSGVHTLGLGIDLGAIRFVSGRVWIYRASDGVKDFPALRKLRHDLWATGKVNQIIDPWETNGVLGHAPGWRSNEGYSQIDREHRNHMHITVLK